MFNFQSLAAMFLGRTSYMRFMTITFKKNFYDQVSQFSTCMCIEVAAINTRRLKMAKIQRYLHPLIITQLINICYISTQTHFLPIICHIIFHSTQTLK
jgi:hypothetical protein